MLLMAGPSACLDPLLKVPITVKNCVYPIEIVFAGGVTAMVCNLGDTAIAPVVPSAAHSTVATLARTVCVVRLE